MDTIPVFAVEYSYKNTQKDNEWDHGIESYTDKQEFERRKEDMIWLTKHGSVKDIVYYEGTLSRIDSTTKQSQCAPPKPQNASLTWIREDLSLK